MACQHCEATGLFEIQNLPGTPVGRFVNPLVRVNAQTQDMKPGMKIPAAYLDLPAPMTTAQLVTLIQSLGGSDLAAVKIALGIS